jgi:uncharacterized protein (TIGR03086 family)
MDNVLGLFDEGVRQFSMRVEAVGSGDWDKPTPDTEWTVADLVKHLIDEHLWIPPLLGGHDLETAGKIVEGTAAGTSPAIDWTAAKAASLQAAHEPGALERTVSLSRGPTPAGEYLAEMIVDLTVHSWDLGKAIGASNELPEELVSFVYPIVVGAQDVLAGSGMFAPPVPCPDDAPMSHKLVALTGRDPN